MPEKKNGERVKFEGGVAIGVMLETLKGTGLWVPYPIYKSNNFFAKFSLTNYLPSFKCDQFFFQKKDNGITIQMNAEY